MNFICISIFLCLILVGCNCTRKNVLLNVVSGNGERSQHMVTMETDDVVRLGLREEDLGRAVAHIDNTGSVSLNVV